MHITNTNNQMISGGKTHNVCAHKDAFCNTLDTYHIAHDWEYHPYENRRECNLKKLTICPVDSRVFGKHYACREHLSLFMQESTEANKNGFIKMKYFAYCSLSGMKKEIDSDVFFNLSTKYPSNIPADVPSQDLVFHIA